MLFKTFLKYFLFLILLLPQTSKAVAVLVDRAELMKALFPEAEDSEDAYASWIEQAKQNHVIPLLNTAKGRQLVAFISKAKTKFPITASGAGGEDQNQDFKDAIEATRKASDNLESSVQLTDEQTALIELFGDLTDGQYSAPDCLKSVVGCPETRAPQDWAAFVSSQQSDVLSAVKEVLTKAKFTDLSDSLTGCELVSETSDDLGSWSLKLTFGGQSGAGFIDLCYWQSSIDLKLTRDICNQWFATAVLKKLYAKFYKKDGLAEKIALYNQDLDEKTDPAALGSLEKALKEVKKEINDKSARTETIKESLEALNESLNNPQTTTVVKTKLRPKIVLLKKENAAIVKALPALKAREAELEQEITGRKQHLGVGQITTDLKQYAADAMKNDPEVRKEILSMAGDMETAGILFNKTDGQFELSTRGLPIAKMDQDDSKGAVLKGGDQRSVFSYGFCSHAALCDFISTLDQGSLENIIKSQSAQSNPNAKVYNAEVLSFLKTLVDGHFLEDASRYGKLDPRAMAMIINLIEVLIASGLNYGEKDLVSKVLPEFTQACAPINAPDVLNRPGGLGSLCKKCSPFAEFELKLKRAGFLPAVLGPDSLGTAFLFGKVLVEGDDTQIKQKVIRKLDELKERFKKVTAMTDKKQSMAELKAIHTAVQHQDLVPGCLGEFLNSSKGISSWITKTDGSQNPFYAFFSRMEAGVPVYQLVPVSDLVAFNQLPSAQENLVGYLVDNPLALFFVNPWIATMLFLSSGDYSLNHIVSEDFLDRFLQMRVNGRAIIGCLAQAIYVTPQADSSSAIVPQLSFQSGEGELVKRTSDPVPEEPIGEEPNADRAGSLVANDERDMDLAAPFVPGEEDDEDSPALTPSVASRKSVDDGAPAGADLEGEGGDLGDDDDDEGKGLAASSSTATAPATGVSFRLPAAPPRTPVNRYPSDAAPETDEAYAGRAARAEHVLAAKHEVDDSDDETDAGQKPPEYLTDAAPARAPRRNGSGYLTETARGRRAPSASGFLQRNRRPRRATNSVDASVGRDLEKVLRDERNTQARLARARAARAASGGEGSLPWVRNSADADVSDADDEGSVRAPAPAASSPVARRPREARRERGLPWEGSKSEDLWGAGSAKISYDRRLVAETPLPKSLEASSDDALLQLFRQGVPQGPAAAGGEIVPASQPHLIPVPGRRSEAAAPGNKFDDLEALDSSAEF